MFYDTKIRYNRFSDHLRNLYGVKVYKVTLDAGFTCPNRDGTISDEGCIFCDNGGSFSQLYSNKISIKEQLDCGIALSKEKYKAQMKRTCILVISVGLSEITTEQCLQDHMEVAYNAHT